MNDSGNAKQQIVEKIKGSTSILVTVSSSPSVDELSAALGLTVLLNKMDKHATAVFSGDMPPAITFLDPKKTFENTVDSLRDFIIALDKEKADHLRYKVDGDVVKIFITPYRTTITSDDLDFSQGDYNVELVLGLGVKDRDSLDQALAAHGRILHDATVATIGSGTASNLGSLDWNEPNASSLSEMMVSLTDALKGDEPLLDEQIATAFLTGIVAATDRFSNNQTSSRVMTMAAQLMSAGANQQLIASKLEEAHAIGDSSDKGNSDGTTDLSEGKPSKVGSEKRKKADPAAQTAEPDAKPADKSQLTIEHTEDEEPETAEQQPEPETPVDATEQALEEDRQKVEAAEQDEAAKVAEADLARQLETVAPAAATTTLSVADLQKDLAAASADVDQAAALPPVGGVHDTSRQEQQAEPSFGGTLNATAEQAAEDKRREEESDRNKTILSHNSGSGYVDTSQQPSFQAPLNAAAAGQVNEGGSDVDIFKQSSPSGVGTTVDTGLSFEPAPIPTLQPPTLAPAPEPTVTPTPFSPPTPTPTLADIDQQAREHDDARAAVNAAFGSTPFDPAGQPQQNVGAQQLGTVPHDDPAAGLPPLPPLPPMPDFSTLPPLPPAPAPVFAPQPTGQPAPTAPPTIEPENFENVLGPAPTQQPADPGQFRIPGQ